MIENPVRKNQAKRNPNKTFMQKKGGILVLNQSNSAKVFKILTTFQTFQSSVTGSHLYEATVFILSLILSSTLGSKRVRTKTKLQGFVWSHWSKKGPISHSQIAIRY